MHSNCPYCLAVLVGLHAGTLLERMRVSSYNEIAIKRSFLTLYLSHEFCFSNCIAAYFQFCFRFHICNVFAVLWRLGEMTFEQRLYEESLQMFSRVRAILMRPFSESEEMVRGKNHMME